MRRDSPRYGNFPKRRKSRESPWNRASPAFGKLWEHAGKCRVDLTEIPIEVRKIREETGLSQNRFAAYFGIPCQTYQQWERKERTSSPYIPQMMDYIIKLEKKVGELEEKVASLEKEKEADQEPDVPESGTIE